MRTATVAEAKEHLEDLIAAARSGETVEITANGEAVAELQSVPGSRRRTPARDPRHRELLDSDVITIGTGASPGLERFPPGSVPSGVLDALLEERREGR